MLPPDVRTFHPAWEEFSQEIFPSPEGPIFSEDTFFQDSPPARPLFPKGPAQIQKVRLLQKVLRPRKVVRPQGISLPQKVALPPKRCLRSPEELHGVVGSYEVESEHMYQCSDHCLIKTIQESESE